MRHLRPFSALLAIAAITVACSSAPGGSSGAQNSQGAEASQGVEASQPSESTGGGGGGGGGGGSGANGSATYEISGEYSASGELPFIPLGLSLFVDGGWLAYFGETGGDTIIQISTNPDGLIASFVSPQVSVSGTVDNGCDFNITKNDSGGLAGSFECRGVQAITGGTTPTLIQVDFRGDFEGHP